MKFYERLFKLLNWCWYILFALAYTDYWPNASELLIKLAFYYKIFISSVLIWFFNPITNYEFTKVHKSIVFTAATFILFSEGLMNIFVNIKNDATSAAYITGNTFNNIGSTIKTIVTS